MTPIYLNAAAIFDRSEHLPRGSLASILLDLATSILSPAIDRATTAIILGAPHGCLQADWEFDRSRREANARYASPAAFTRTLPSTHAAELSVKLGLRGPLLTLSAGNISALMALHRARAWMNHLPITACLTGGFDSGSTPEEHPRAALLLLLTRNRTPVPLHVLSPTFTDLSSSNDESLTELIQWIREGHPTILHQDEFRGSGPPW